MRQGQVWSCAKGRGTGLHAREIGCYVNVHKLVAEISLQWLLFKGGVCVCVPNTQETLHLTLSDKCSKMVATVQFRPLFLRLRVSFSLTPAPVSQLLVCNSLPQQHHFPPAPPSPPPSFQHSQPFQTQVSNTPVIQPILAAFVQDSNCAHSTRLFQGLRSSYRARERGPVEPQPRHRDAPFCLDPEHWLKRGQEHG